MPFYGHDTWDGISGNPLGELYDVVMGYCTDSTAPILSMIIYCEQEKREALAEKFESSLKQYAEEHNDPDEELHYCDSVVFEYFEEGIYVFTPTHTSVEDEESEIDPLVDPLLVAIESIRKQHRSVRIVVCLPYHFNIGYNYGCDILWAEGNTKPLIAKQLAGWMKSNDFWDCCSFEEVDHEAFLEYLLDLSDEMDAEWVHLFWSHIPVNDPCLRARLLERLHNWNANHADRAISEFTL